MYHISIIIIITTIYRHIAAIIQSSTDPRRWLMMLPLCSCVMATGGFTRSVRYFWYEAGKGVVVVCDIVCCVRGIMCMVVVYGVVREGQCL